MFFSRKARPVAVAAIAVLVPLIAGCEAGLNAPTLHWHRPTPGASTVVGDIRINNVFILGATPDSSLMRGSSAGLFLALANTGAPDRLLSISAPGEATSVQLPGGGVTLGNRPVLLTGPVPQVVLVNLLHGLRGGQFIRIVLNFQNAGPARMNVPVMPKAQYFASYSPVPSPTPTPTGTATSTASPSASPTASPTSSP